MTKLTQEYCLDYYRRCVEELPYRVDNVSQDLVADLVEKVIKDVTSFEKDHFDS